MNKVSIIYQTILLIRIDCIVNDNVQSPSPEKKAFAMLKSWYDKGSGSTYYVLSEALKNVGKARLADKYCKTSKSKDDSGYMCTAETDTSHDIEPLTETEAELLERADVCQEQIHDKAVLEYICKTCQKCICQKCTVVTHKSHDFECIKEAATKAKARLQETENKIQEVDDAFKKQTNKDIDTRREIKNQIKETRQAIQKNSHRLVEMLKRHEQQLLTEVDAFEEDAEKTFEDQAKNSKLRRELLNSFTEQLRGVRLQADIEVLKAEQSVMSQAQEVFDALANYQPLKIVYVEHKPDEDVSSRLDNSPLGQVGSGLADPQKTQIQELTNRRIEKERRTQFTIVTKDTEDNICYSASEHVSVQIMSPTGSEVETEVEDRKDGTYTVCFTPNTEGVHHVTVRVRGQSPANSPFHVHVSKSRPCEYRAVATFGSRGSGKGQLKHPAGIAVNRSGELVAVSDSINNRVQIFSADGQYLREFGTTGTADGQFDYPLGLAYNKAGHIVVADCCNSRIQVFSSIGRWISKFGQKVLTRPGCVSVTSDDKIVVSDRQDYTVNVFFPVGVLLLQFSLERLAINTPRSAIFCNGKYFVSVDSHVIKVFDSRGSFLYNFGQHGRGSLAVDGTHDLLLVCDGINHRVQVVTFDGEVVTSFGSHESVPTNYFCPGYIAVSHDGHVFVSETFNNRVKVFQPAKNVAFV